MPQVIYANSAIRDLQRVKEFLQSKNPSATRRATQTIINAIKTLRQQPQIGRSIENIPDEFREWLINFGNGGYVIRYKFDGNDVTILAVRHQREVGYYEYEEALIKSQV